MIEHHEFNEKLIHSPNGWCMLYVSLGLLVLSVACLLGAIIGPAMNMDILLIGYAILPFSLITICVICSGL